MSFPYFVVNPRSAGGRTGRRWAREIEPRVRERFGGRAQWAFTRQAGDGAVLAEQACRDGAGTVVAVGGDGTLHEVVNGLMAWPSARPLLGLVPNGTGCDFARTIGIPRDAARAIDALAARESVLADVCEIECAAPGGGRLRRFSINTSGCGVGGVVASSVNRWSGRRHGLLAFLFASLAAVARYRPASVSLALDGRRPEPLRLLALFVCNGEYCGGGMRPGRGARIDDGLLRVVTIEAMHPARIAVNVHRLYSGRVEGVRGVHVADATRVDVVAADDVLVDCDGEQPGTAPARFTLRPAALQVIVGR